MSVSHAVAHAVSCVLLKSSSSTTTFFSTTSNLLCHHLCPLGLDATDRCLPIGGSSSNGGDDSCCALTTNSHLRFNAVQSNGGNGVLTLFCLTEPLCALCTSTHSLIHSFSGTYCARCVYVLVVCIFFFAESSPSGYCVSVTGAGNPGGTEAPLPVKEGHCPTNAAV